VEAVCAYLVRHGWTIEQRLTTTQTGIDIIASCSEGRLLIEAKGGTSSRDGSARFGKEYTATQAFDRVTKGLLTGFELMERANLGENVGLAFPNDPYFVRYVARVKTALAKTGLRVFWVNRDRTVVEGVMPLSA
jgi:hypothetical protein